MRIIVAIQQVLPKYKKIFVFIYMRQFLSEYVIVHGISFIGEIILNI